MAPPPPPYEEVVIDGDTSSNDDEEEEVLVITPRSRKRRRQSMDADDEDELEEEQPPSSTNNTNPPQRPQQQKRAASTTSVQQDNGDDDDDDDGDVEIIAAPSSADGKKKSRRLTILDSDEEQDTLTRTKECRDGETKQEEEEDDEIEDVRRPRASPTAKRAATNRLEVEPVRRLSSSFLPSSSRGTTPLAVTTTPHGSGKKAATSASTSSSSRRSSRIERKREEKEKLGPSARKLEFLSLDNCLDQTAAGAAAAAAARARRSQNQHQRFPNDADDDSDEFIVDDDDASDDDDDVEEVVAPPPKKRQRPPPTKTTTRRTYADGDDDLDDFIADDNEVEYMDDDEEGVMDQALSSGDEMDEEDTETNQENIRAAMQSREPSEWFSIYLRYLEESILDDELDTKMRKSPRRLEYQLFKQATHHIERAICSRRDALRSSVVWNDAIMENLHCATRFHSMRCAATTDCQACRRANHYATQLVQFGGFACDATVLYKENWMNKLKRAVGEMDPITGSFELGTVCHARTLGYWQLLHAKHFWVAIVDAKRKECSDGHGRIAKSQRIAFHKSEFGRYKRLINLVDKFSTESTQSVGYMPNVWKKVTSKQIHSDFLPANPRKGKSKKDDFSSAAPRRGTMDSFVGESGEETTASDGEVDEEEEEEEEVEEKPKRQSDRSDNSTTDEREEVVVDDDDEEDEDAAEPSRQTTPRQKMRMRQSSIVGSLTGGLSTTTTTTRMSPQTDAARVKNDAPTTSTTTSTNMTTAMKPVSEIDAEDLLCLVCKQNQRDGAIVHGHYLHFYCCFRCAKRQHAANHSCMVCDRPIDSVFRILPLSREARADILKQQTA